MKIVIDERVKHRLIGLAVILSIAAIFAPAVMKKSNQRIDGNINVSVKLPPKPAQPEIDLIEKKAMFESAKTAHVELPKASELKPSATVARAEPLSHASEPLNAQGPLALLEEDKNRTTSNLTTENQVLAEEEVNISTATKKMEIAQKITKAIRYEEDPVQLKSLSHAKRNPVKPLVKSGRKILVKHSVKSQAKNGYSIQLATFTKIKNADALITKLKVKGYKANCNRIKTKNGFIYKVLVGQMPKKEQAQHLQKKLANSVQLRGFIVSSAKG